MKQVTVGLSGGVDSAVAALLLKESGYDVTGVFMRNWDEKDPYCPARSDYEDVRSICDVLNIPYYSVNFEREYRERVFSVFLREYEAGRTPNPDVLCNSEIKFDAFLDFAMDSGSEAVATGHYARIGKEGQRILLLRAADAAKDQTYFLCLLNQKQLSKAMFPLGDLHKGKVREMAAAAGLPVAAKKDSTGICFVGERDFKEFLMRWFPQKKGEIRLTTEEVVGEHDGLIYYTLGQRRGLRLGGLTGREEGRWFVVGKDMARNVLYVSHSEEALYVRALTLESLHFIAEDRVAPFFCGAKVRYRQPDQEAYVERCDDRWIVSFAERQRAVAPGQYCVLYDGDVCLGGGVIANAMDESPSFCTV